MNLFDITNEDIERLQRGITQDEITDRDTEISRLLGGDAFDWVEKLYLKPDYTLPAPTEAEIIKYLKASTVPPSQWHPAAQEWAKRHDEYDIWEYFDYHKCWTHGRYVYAGWDNIPHRLRADYGKKDAGHVEFTDPPKSINPSDVSYGPFTLEPEVCVWEHPTKSLYRNPHRGGEYADSGYIKLNPFCPVCGKRIEIKP